jgi:SAM-dependent methyltransferase
MSLFYNNPPLYDAVFGVPRMIGRRSVVDVQSKFIERICQSHNTGIRRVVELAAGPAYHAIWFASRGYDVTVMDRSRAMLNYSQERAREAGTRIRAIDEDIRGISSLPFDCQVQLANCRVAKKSGNRSSAVTGRETLRIVLPRDLELLCLQIAGLTLVAEFGAFKSGIHVNSGRAWRILQIYQRPGSAKPKQVVRRPSSLRREGRIARSVERIPFERNRNGIPVGWRI